MKIALISGTSILKSELFADWEEGKIATPHGEVTFKIRGDRVVLNRHGAGTPRPPHAINHRANVRALALLGCLDVVALNSVGSLRPDLPPGSLVSCADYVALTQGPLTFFDAEMKDGVSGLANPLIPLLREKLAPEFQVLPGQVYVQTRGPRFETKAEIRILRQWGDVVGMTLAHEADLCAEAGLRLNSLAMVDNYANGIEGAEIDFARFQELVRTHQGRVNRLLTRVLEILA